METLKAIHTNVAWQRRTVIRVRVRKEEKRDAFFLHNRVHPGFVVITFPVTHNSMEGQETPQDAIIH